ncbi:VPA1262 family N-terminal domain-containing protein [Aliarcobacter skirrowii]|uniref:VPA1262 family N-terminal domain-containing protein n=1 Tax=Aliarcobacter skirrowii TaxID=28200 RepID=UPI003209E0B3
MNYITWLYFLVENKKKENQKVIFLYGLTLPTKNEKYTEINIKSKNIGLNKEIVVFSNICESYLSVKDGLISFDGFIKNNTKEALNIINYKRIIQVATEVNRDIPNSLMTTPLYTKCFYTDEFYHYYDEQNFETSSIESLVKILEVLENMTGQKFTSNYSKRLGCYEIGQPQNWVEEKTTPFVVDTQKQEETLKYIFKIDEDYIFEKVTIHLIVYNNDNEVVKDIIKTTHNDREVFLTEIKKEDNASLEYWIFDKNDKLIDRNKYGFIRSISLNANLLGKTYDINAKNYSNKSPLKDKNRCVATYSQGFKNNIEVDKIPDIEEKANKLYQRLKTYKEEDTLYKNGVWFNIGEHENIIKFLNKITMHGAYKITFIDPFISSDSLDYLYHLENKQISIQFISCWENDISPDDSDKPKKTNISIDELQQRLNEMQDFNIPLKNAQWYNFKSKQFHDRFIYIENISNGEKQVYSMSNSLNNMLKKYSFLVIPLKGEVLQKSLLYLDSIFLKCNDEYKIYPKKESLD